LPYQRSARDPRAGAGGLTFQKADAA
jgi:hypothetical protein